MQEAVIRMGTNHLKEKSRSNALHVIVKCFHQRSFRHCRTTLLEIRSVSKC